ncbi:hypothetical protein VD0002_g1052 [Verticillium dahliae]|uniref:Uncharacterized protein n=2 Tax=Verticillium dahliae TaxID=27337 RepID=G2XJG8_VERDV|nr:uncharacterized protein VDAG_10369 [Verticillium dahliae VdLs.17]KAH6700037.1 hypothetical protein EV126DRAFT_26133 [Verticillium dahliae]EGY20671.1 hypothetical protein VDAG_10369 [Verticillium dahliae VdLs.17]PNH26578.1 hypothetical protein BJF96_g10109 [Verticillium dahliae]PNH55396.1 hypothetical protein VD0003_g2226 [Verticillium dahliae]PNH69257.1 hypothetical protein VD0002_g1052 [Verticillium dahliae]
MGFFDFDSGSVISGRSSHSRRHSSHPKSSKRRDRSRSRSSSRKHQDKGFAASLFGGDNYQKHSSSRSSFFGQPNASRSSFFGFSRPSYYKRSPRGGFLHKAKKTVKRLWRDLMRLLKENPGKVVMLVLMPLLTGGFLTALLAKFGLRLPPSVERMIGMGARAAGGDSFGAVGEAVRMASGSFGGAGGGGQGAKVNIQRGMGNGMAWEKKTVEKDFGWGDTIGGMAKMFI